MFIFLQAYIIERKGNRERGGELTQETEGADGHIDTERKTKNVCGC